MADFKGLVIDGEYIPMDGGSGGGSYVIGSATFSQTITGSGNVTKTIAASFGRVPKLVLATLDNVRFQIYGTGEYSASGFMIRLHNLSGSSQTQSITVKYVAFF